MFDRIKRYFLKRMYTSCAKEVIWNRNFYRKGILLDPSSFSDLPSERRLKIYEEEILAHIPYDSYKIYKNMFGADFHIHLMLDAFGYSDLKNEVVEDLFMDKCRNEK